MRVTAGNPVRVTEKDFLKSQMGERIIAVVIEDHDIEPGKTSRFFIVEERGGES